MTQVIRLNDVDWSHESHTHVIYPIGDVHVGSSAFNESMLCNIIKEVQNNEHAKWIGMGDMVEAITINDPRFDAKSLSDKIKANEIDDLGKKQVEMLSDLLAPIKDKCIGVLCGNHEDTLRRKTSNNIYSTICNIFNVPQLGFDAFFTWRFYKTSTCYKKLVIYATHGSSGGRLAGAPINVLERYASYYDADIYMLGHVHKNSAGIITYETVLQNGTVAKKNKYLAVCNTFATNNPELGYGKCKNMAPIPNTTCKIMVSDNKAVSRNDFNTKIDIVMG